MKLSTSLMCILFYLSSLIHNGENHVINGKPLHHLMTREEIKRFFGEEHLSNVPEYDVALPFETNEEGSFLTYSLNHQLKRSLAEDDNNDTTMYHYKIHALGEQLHLHVKRNTNFMAPGLQLETRDEKGQRITKPVSRKAYVTGKVDSDPGSLVSLSVSDGLTGIVKRSNDTFLIHPLPTHLARHFETKEGARPHLVFRGLSQEDIECHTKADNYTMEKRDLNPLDTTSQLEEDSNDSGIIDKYMEVALLADEQIVAVHRDNTEEFLLLIASIVDDWIFHDRTIGDIKINFVITRLVLISNEELGIDPTNSNIKHIDVVHKVAAWARNNNQADESDPLQFDVALLIRSGGEPGGIGRIAGVCRSDDTASVVRGNGLQTAYLVAHETAHNLGVGHDGNKCPNGVNIMSTVLGGGPGSVEWSSCSRETIQNFLMSSVSACLDDPPTSTRPKVPAAFYTELPGELVDADTQCQLQYGTEYRRCPQRESDCASLFCTPDGYKCITRSARPVDGTPCGLRHWCIKGACVDNGSPRVHGGWSEWSADYTACTPSCGGGLRYRERTCTDPPAQNGGDDCAGPSKTWEICNSDVTCNPSEPSFRDQQCKQINPTYTAYYRSGVNPCSLNCKTGSSSASSFGNVVDGTRCSSDLYDYDVCIEGKCQVVGCDYILKSGKVKDRCGICDGNGDSCTLVNSSYTKDFTVYYGADTIVDLPAKSAHAVFQQRNVPQYNLIGVKDENGNYLIKIPTWSRKDIYYAGTKISYINYNEKPDRLTIEGPTTKDLKIVYVHLQRQSVGVDFTYYRPLESNETHVPATCYWYTSDWTDCSTGQRRREVYCERTDDLSPASENCCGGHLKPNAIDLCFGWHVTAWDPCTKTCGKGSQSRSVVCRAKLNDTHYKIESDSFCDASSKPNIIEHQYCNEIQCPASWTNHSSECPTVCLPGEQTKYTKCSRSNELGENEDVSDIQCGYEPKPPPITEPCNEDNPCKELVIGCFDTPQGLFSEMLGDFTNEDPDSAIMMCGELTHEKGYHVFALGYGGLCMSGPDAQDKYYLEGQPKTSRKRIENKCSNGIGIGPNSVAYTFDPLPAFEPVGCFKDNGNDRALPDYYANFRLFIDWYNLDATIRQCALVARDIGYEYFAVQFYGECWSSFDAAPGTYDRYGEQTNLQNCWANVGGPNTNFVYRFL